jgi:hypothetical protein
MIRTAITAAAFDAVAATLPIGSVGFERDPDDKGSSGSSPTPSTASAPSAAQAKVTATSSYVCRSARQLANEEHLDLLRQGVEVWNAWRMKERSTKPDLSGDGPQHGEPRRCQPECGETRWDVAP